MKIRFPIFKVNRRAESNPVAIPESSPGLQRRKSWHSCDFADIVDPVQASLVYAADRVKTGERMMADPTYWDQENGTNVGKYVMIAASRIQSIIEMRQFSEDPETRLEEVIASLTDLQDGLEDDEYSFTNGTINPLISEFESRREAQKGPSHS